MKKILIIGDDLSFVKEIIDLGDFNDTTEIIEISKGNRGVAFFDDNNIKKKIIKTLHNEVVFGGVLAIRNNHYRKIIFDIIQDISENFNFISIIHPSVVIGKNITIGKGSILNAGVVVNSDSIIGVCCIIGAQSSVGHEGVLQDFSSISCGVITGGNLVLGSLSSLSLGVRVKENITIGNNTFISAGSLVLKNIPDNKVAYGAPVKVVKSLISCEEYVLEEFKEF